MHGAEPGFETRTSQLRTVAAATGLVAVAPGLLAGGLQSTGLIRPWWLSIGVAIALSMVATTVGSKWWARRPGASDTVFADLMVWGWLRRRRAERRVASTSWLLGSPGRFGPELQGALLERLSEALEARDLRVHGHSKRVARHAQMICERLDLPRRDTARIRAAAAVHDVGKIETPRAILNKPGPLTDPEFELIKDHAARGGEMVATVGDDELTAIVRHHHERLDGGGYPDGLSGDRIPLGARVIAVADTFDAMTSGRPYRPALSHEQALDILRREAGIQLDPQVVDAFLDYYTGRRWIPWLAAVAAAPARGVAWVLNGVQGAVAAPLAGGAAALGTTLLLGASVTAQPAPTEGDSPSKAERASAVAALQDAPRRPVTLTDVALRDRGRATPGRRGRAGLVGPGAGTERGGSGGSTPTGGAPTGGGLTGEPSSSTAESGGSKEAAVSLRDAPSLPELPSLPQAPTTPQLPAAPELPAAPNLPAPQLSAPQLSAPQLSAPQLPAP